MGIEKSFLCMGEWVTSYRNPLRGVACWGGPHAVTKTKTKTHTKMEPQTIEIKGAQIFRLRVLESGISYAKDSKLSSEKYSRVTYNGTVFTINDKDPFLADLTAGKVHTAFLIETSESIKTTDADGKTTDGTVTRLAFDGYASNAQMIGLTNTEAVLQNIMKGSFKAEAELSEEDVKALEQ
jgi:hypothetical protein